MADLPPVKQTHKAAASQFAAAVQAATAATAKLAEQLLAGLLKSAKPYLLPFGWRCSWECGKPIRFGEVCVTTSPDLQPWERAHAACLTPRKGADSDRSEPASTARSQL